MMKCRVSLGLLILLLSITLVTAGCGDGSDVVRNEDVTSQEAVASEVGVSQIEGVQEDIPFHEGNLTAYRGRNGDILTLKVVGRTEGRIWGNIVYTDDSDLGTVAVHAGFLEPGQEGVLTVHILPGYDMYESVTKNSVSSSSYGNWHGSYEIWEGYVTKEADLIKKDTEPEIIAENENYEEGSQESSVEGLTVLPTPSDFSKIGNTGGNIANMGFVAQEGDWIYYPGEPDGIYKMNVNGTNRIKITDDPGFFINVVDDWVYYSNLFDSGYLYKIRSDGSMRTQLNTDMSWYINVVGDCVYYSNMTEGERIYVIRTDGSERSQVNDKRSWYLNVSEGWIYYSNLSDYETLEKIRIDGTERTKYPIAVPRVHFINVVDEWIYYVTLDIVFKEPKSLSKVRLDGKEVVHLDKLKGLHLSVTGNWIYFLNLSNQLCKVSTAGGDVTVISDGVTNPISIHDNWIYYIDSVDNEMVWYRTSTDGSITEQFH